MTSDYIKLNFLSVENKQTQQKNKTTVHRERPARHLSYSGFGRISKAALHISAHVFKKKKMEWLLDLSRKWRLNPCRGSVCQSRAQIFCLTIVFEMYTGVVSRYLHVSQSSNTGMSKF